MSGKKKKLNVENIETGRGETRLGSIVDYFSQQDVPSADDIMALASLQIPTSATADGHDEQYDRDEVKLFLMNVKECLGSHGYQIFLDLMSQIRQGYRTDQPAVVVEKFDMIKGILTRENPELRLKLDRYFPIHEAMKRKEILEQYAIQQSEIQFQKWKIQYQSKMSLQSPSQRTSNICNSQYLPSSTYPTTTTTATNTTFNNDLMPPLKSSHHFIPIDETLTKRKYANLSPAQQFQSIITAPAAYESFDSETSFGGVMPTLPAPPMLGQSPLELLRQLATQPLPLPRLNKEY